MRFLNDDPEELERKIAARKVEYAEISLQKLVEKSPASFRDPYNELGPSFYIRDFCIIDNYVQCFSGPVEDCIKLSDAFIDHEFSQCTGYSPLEQRRRAEWLKSEVNRLLRLPE